MGNAPDFQRMIINKLTDKTRLLPPRIGRMTLWLATRSISLATRCRLRCSRCSICKDVAKALGYKNPQKALRDHVDEDDKGVTKCSTLGGNQKMTVINESGLYSLILSSKLKEAKSYSHT